MPTVFICFHLHIYCPALEAPCHEGHFCQSTDPWARLRTFPFVSSYVTIKPCLPYLPCRRPWTANVHSWRHSTATARHPSQDRYVPSRANSKLFANYCCCPNETLTRLRKMKSYRRGHHTHLKVTGGNRCKFRLSPRVIFLSGAHSSLQILHSTLSCPPFRQVDTTTPTNNLCSLVETSGVAVVVACAGGRLLAWCSCFRHWTSFHSMRKYARAPQRAAHACILHT